MYLLPCSPIGEVFRSRLRQFPSLVTCCTIDWFSEWPDEALKSVASSSLNELTEIDSTDAVEGLVYCFIVEAVDDNKFYCFIDFTLAVKIL